MFLWHLAPVVADVTLGVRHRVWFTTVLRSCGMLGNLTPPRERYVGWVCAHVSCWGAQTVHYIWLRHNHVPLPQESSSYQNQNYTSRRRGKDSSMLMDLYCTVQHSDSKEGLSCFICLCHFVDHQQSYVTQYHKKSLIQNIQDYCYDESNKKSKLLFTGMKTCLLKVDELPQAAIFKEAKKQDEKVLPVYYLLFIPSLYRTRKSNRGCSQALDDLGSHKINCHLLSWVLTNDQDAQLENVPVPYKPFFSRKRMNPVPCIIKILPKLSLAQTASWII